MEIIISFICLVSMLSIMISIAMIYHLVFHIVRLLLSILALILHLILEVSFLGFSFKEGFLLNYLLCLKITTIFILDHRSQHHSSACDINLPTYFSIHLDNSMCHELEERFHRVDVHLRSLCLSDSNRVRFQLF